MLFVFFFKQKTAYEMRISDWSSDVCSSDLASDDATVVLLDDHHGGPRRHAVDEVRPARRRVGEGRFSLEARIGLGAVCRGVLHGDEQCRGVRRETRAAEFGANRDAEEHLAVAAQVALGLETPERSEEHTSELQSLI